MGVKGLILQPLFIAVAHEAKANEPTSRSYERVAIPVYGAKLPTQPASECLSAMVKTMVVKIEVR